MQFRNRARTGDDQRHGAVRRDAIDGAPSAAWLEAQQAFSEQRPAAPGPAVVIVRKGRALVAAAPVAEAAPDQSGPPAEKVARVFRVVLAGGLSASSVPPDLNRYGPQSPGEGTGVGRKRRFDAEKRPGPVLRTVPVAPVQARQLGQSEPSTHRVPVLHPLAELRRMLARVDAVIDDIRRARAFRFVEENSAGSWEGLSGATTAVQEQLDRLAARSPGRGA